MSEWPELEPCVCGAAVAADVKRDGEHYVCCQADIDDCDRAVYGRNKQECAAGWNAMQRVAKGEKEPK